MQVVPSKRQLTHKICIETVWLGQHVNNSNLILIRTLSFASLQTDAILNDEKLASTPQSAQTSPADPVWACTFRLAAANAASDVSASVLATTIADRCVELLPPENYYNQYADNRAARGELTARSVLEVCLDGERMLRNMTYDLTRDMAYNAIVRARQR